MSRHSRRSYIDERRLLWIGIHLLRRPKANRGKIALDAAVAGRIEALLSTTDLHFEIAGRDTGMDLGCLLTIVIEPN